MRHGTLIAALGLALGATFPTVREARQMAQPVSKRKSKTKKQRKHGKK